MQINVDSAIRSAVVLVIGLPVALGLTASMKANIEKPEATAAEVLKSDLTIPCLKYALTDNDSKGERASKDAIDEVFGDGANYREVCKWVLG